jgi:hypothetical protein
MFTRLASLFIDNGESGGGIRRVLLSWDLE